MGPSPKFAEICKPDQARARRLAGRLSPSPKISGPDPTLFYMYLSMMSVQELELRTRTAHMIRIACLFGMGADDQITLSQHYSLLSIWAFISSHIKALWALELVACVLQSTPVGKRDRPEKLYDDEIASLLLLFFSSGYIGCQLVRMHQNLYKIVR